MSDADGEALAWARENLPTDPGRVVDAMMRAGWLVAGGRTGVYVRLLRSDNGRQTIVVPLRPDYPDYPSLMAGVMAELAIAVDAGRRAQRVLDDLGCGDAVGVGRSSS